MNDQTDQALLRDYAANRSDAAFAELVHRYVDLVYSAALRMIGDVHHAEDVTQAVFAALAQNAVNLTHHTLLSGWLHRTTRNLAANTIRTLSRRQKREQEAVAMNELLATGSGSDWQHIAPQLDSALDELPDADREALLLRYFEQKSAADIAVRLGITDDAAQKRVSRAMDRLREIFTRRRITVGASGLALAISSHAVHAAPVGLAANISGVAFASGAITTTTITAAKAIAMTTLQKVFVLATVAALAGAGIYETHQAGKLQTENRSLLQQQQRQAALLAQTQKLQNERDDLTNKLASSRDEINRLNHDVPELLELRGEVGTLRSSISNLSQVTNDPIVQKALAAQAKETRLRQLLAERPDQKIPELSLLDNQTFSDVAREADLNTEDGIRTALSRLHFISENQIANIMQPALQLFTQANNDNPPQSVAQLAPYIDPPVDAAIFDRYQILETGTNIVAGWRGGWVISQKQAVDADHDRRWMISPVGFQNAEFKSSGP